MSKNCVQKTVLALGIVELLMANIVMACGLTAFVKRSNLANIGHGIWGSFFLIVTSSFAIQAGKRQAFGLHVAHMVMAILSCVIIIPAMDTIFGIELFRDLKIHTWGYNSKGEALMGPTNISPVLSEIIAMAISGLLVLLFVISAAFTCCAVCKCCGAIKRESVVYPFTNDTAIVLYTTPNSNYPIQFSGYPVNPQYPPVGFLGNPAFTVGQQPYAFTTAGQQQQMTGQVVGWRNVGFVMPPAYNQQTTFTESLDGADAYVPVSASPHVEKSADIY